MRSLAAASCVTVLFVCAASCGARTGLEDYGASASASADGGTDSGRIVDAATDAAVPCTPGSFTLDRADPAVLFVLDRSRSMAATFSNGNSRWEVLTEALASALAPVDKTMSMGALAFPDSSTNGSCTVAGAPDLLPGLGNADALVSLMRTKGTGGSTPTADAIDVAGKAMLGIRAASTARTMVLATDGGPDCNSALDPSTCRCVSGTSCNTAARCLDDTRTIERITSYAAQSIPTYVIGIGSATDTTNNDVLDAMAVAGGRPQTATAHRYYGANSAAELNAALVAIRNQVGACTYLTRSVPNAAGTITVVVAGEIIPYDPTGATGWRWADQANGEIVFLGDLCTKVAQAGAAPSVDVSCTPPRDGGTDASGGGVDAEAGSSTDASLDAADDAGM